MNISDRLVLPVALGLSLASCAEETRSTQIGGGAASANDPDGGTDMGSATTGGQPDPGSDDGNTGNCHNPGPNEDLDQDGYTKAQGDCNDCSVEINPGAIDFPGNEHDEDCSGAPASAEEDAMGCDDGSLRIDSRSAEDAARAIGLCKFIDEDEPGWGVISARFTTADGTGGLKNPMMVGLLPTFGAAEPRAGESVLALSTGVARAPGQAGYTPACDMFCSGPLGDLFGCPTDPGENATPPDGYPKESTECEAVSGGLGGLFDPEARAFNQAALELKIRAPTNANSFAFDSVFYTYEFPNFICSQFNDFFVVLKEPRPADVPDGNIVFDAAGNSIGVNSGLLAVCDVNAQDPLAAKQFACDQGTSLLQGTGYGASESSCGAPSGGASTGWLQTTAPVARGEVLTIRFAIWDTGDQTLDSTALIDNFRWSIEEPDVETTPIIL